MFSRESRFALWLVAALPLVGMHVSAQDLDDAIFVSTPAAAGSLGPHLASGGDGSLLLSWLEPADRGHALRFSRWSASGWSVPATVARGDDWFVNWADFPSVVPISEKFWVAHWLVRRPAGGYAYDIYVAVSNDGGETWGAGIPLHDDDTDTEHGFVSIYPAGAAAGLVWLDGRNTLQANGGMTLRAATLTEDGQLVAQDTLDDRVCDCCQTATIASDDKTIVAYRDRTQDEVRDISIVQHVDGAWTGSEPAVSDGWQIAGCPVNGPVLAQSGPATAVAWFTAVANQPRVRLSYRHGDAIAFDAPIEVIEGNTLGRVGLALLEDGSAIVSSITRTNGGTPQLVLLHVAADGRRDDALNIANSVHPFSVPQLELHEGELFAAWTVRRENETHVESARIPLTSPRQQGVK